MQTEKTTSAKTSGLTGRVLFLRKMKRWQVIAGLIAGLAILAAVAATVFFWPKSQDWRKNTAKVERGSIDVRIIATGTIRPLNEVKVSPKSTGLIKQLYVKQGDVVKEGQTLAQMDNSNLLGQLEAARGTYLVAKDNYEKMLNGNRPQEVEIARFQEKRARDIVQEAGHNIIRLKAQVESMTQQSIRDDSMAQRQSYLDEQGVISDQDKLNAETQSKMTRAQLDAARRELAQAEATMAQNKAELSAAEQQHELSRIGNRREDINAARDSVLQAKGSLDTLQSQMNDMTIKAPFAGVITQKYADTGAIVTPTTSAATTSATSSSIVALAGDLEMVAEVAETDIGKIKLGQPVEIVSNAYTNRTFHGRVTQIAPEAVVTQNVTTFEVHTTVDDGQTGGTLVTDSADGHNYHRRHHDGGEGGDHRPGTPTNGGANGAGTTQPGAVAQGGDSDHPRRHHHHDGNGGSAQGDGGAQPTADAASSQRDDFKPTLLSGMNVSARFVAGKLDNTLLVPTVCIVSKHGKTGVLVAQPDGTPKFKPVKTGPTVDTKTAVLHGLNEGDLVFLGLDKGQLEQQGYSDGSFGNRGQRDGGRGGGGGGGGGTSGAPIPRSFGR